MFIYEMILLYEYDTFNNILKIFNLILNIWNIIFQLPWLHPENFWENNNKNNNPYE